MNYFELINKCLVELNYKKSRTFDELTKNDHDKIKNILNILNAEVCTFDNWNFLLRKASLQLPGNSSEIENTIVGKINTLTIDGKKFNFVEDYEKFLLGNQSPNTYGVLNDKLLFPTFSGNKTIEIVYYTNNFAKQVNGIEKKTMSLETDVPLIPEPFLEPLLVYGTCMRLKANPQYTKFNYWYGMYRDTLATMRSKLATDAKHSPSITLKRD